MDSSPSPRQVGTLVDLWNEEHADLTQTIHQTNVWLAEVSQLGIPRFGELATRLRGLRDRLARHFDREDTIGSELKETCESPELAATRRQAAADHRLLTERIDALIAKLSEPDPSFNTFQQAIDEVSSFVDAFEQHEEQEAQGLQWLTAYNSDSRNLPR